MIQDSFQRGPELFIYPQHEGSSRSVQEWVPGKYALHVQNEFTQLDDFSETQAHKAVRETYRKVVSRFTDYLQGQHGPATAGEHVSGIVIGSVQSGKTISFTAAVALAFDAGAAAAIVISGNDSALRDQTLDRLREYFGDVADVSATLEVSTHSADVSRDVAVKKIIDGRRRTVIVAMKEDDHLKEIEKIVGAISYHLPDEHSPNVVVIDDEGDQGSLNGLAGLARKGIKKSTTLHSSIARISESRCIAAYVAYTATAFANALTDQETPIYPRGFVSVLDPGDGYLGLQDLFLDGAFEPLVKLFPPGFRDYVDESIESAVDHFLLVTEMKARFRDGLDSAGLPQLPEGCLVMGVNAGHKNSTHERAIHIIRERLNYWQQRDVDGSSLMAHAQDIDPRPNSPIAKVAREYREWVENRSLTLSGSIVELNQFGSTRLRSFRTLPDRILVGGQLLGRGFTLPRMTTYVLAPSQDSAYMDVLQQRARFLGYRKPYAPWIRIWMDSEARASFAKLANAEVSFRYQNRVLEDNGLGLDALDSFIVLAGKHGPTSRGKIARGKKERSTWWVSGRGCANTPEYISAFARNAMTHGQMDRRGAWKIEISGAEARQLVDAFVEHAPGDSARLRGGLELALGPKRDPDSNARVTVYVMSQWEEGRERQLDGFGAVEQLFSGHGRDLQNDPAENQIYSEETALSIQLHRIQFGLDLGVGIAMRPTNKIAPNRMLWILG